MHDARDSAAWNVSYADSLLSKHLFIAGSRDTKARRISKLRNPGDLSELDIEMHELRNSEILQRREGSRKAEDENMKDDSSDDEDVGGDGDSGEE